jgi:twinkle protein
VSKIHDLVKKLEENGKIPEVDFDQYFKANDDDTQKVKRAVDYFDDIETFINDGVQLHGVPLPFPRFKDKFRFRSGEVTMWSGQNGHRKSMALGFASLHFLKHKEKVCIASFEMKPISTLTRMARQHTGVASPGYDEFSDLLAFVENNLYVFDHMGGMKPDRLYGVILYCAQELGVKHFVIDSLMRVIAGEDKYNEQKDFVVKLCEIAQKTGCHIHLVHHAKKGREDQIGGRYDAKGSGAISDNVHNCLTVWSNKEKNKDLPDVVIKCDKQREGEWEGSIPLTFNEQSLTFEEAF